MQNLEIVEVNYQNLEHLETLGNIHQSVLPESNIPGLGKLFMNQFYYKVLPQRGLLRCFFAKCDGQYAGILVCNRYPFSLIKKGLVGNYFKVAFILVISLLMKPSRLKFLINQMKYSVDPLLKQYEESGKAFEILTIGVLEKYRSIRFSDNKKIAHRLVDHAIRIYKKDGFSCITGQILKSNIPVLKFYGAYNARYIDSSVRDTGVIMDLNLDLLENRKFQTNQMPNL